MAERKIELFGLKEDPDLWERLIEAEIKASATDQKSKSVVEAMYWEKDRAQAFQRFFDSLDFRQIVELLGLFGIQRKRPLCEIGGGSGQLAWALAKSNFEEVELLEPNPRWITGTAFLQSQLVQFNTGLTICNDLEAWYSNDKLFHTIITRNCIHHFPNLPMAAAAIRQKVEKGGTWVAIREWFADTPAEMNKLIAEHPYCQKYGVYECPFPARYYVDSIEYAGFKLVAVVPFGWGNNNVAGLSAYNDPGTSWNQNISKLWRYVFRYVPQLTVGLYRLENFCNHAFGMRFRRFTRPQMMVFARIEI